MTRRSRAGALLTAAPVLAVLSLHLATRSLVAQEPQPLTRYEGSAVVRVADSEYTIVILCEDAARPELGFTTEPNRITRQRTGRPNRVSLRLEPWRDTGDVLVSLDDSVAWLARPVSSGGRLSFEARMSSVSITREGVPARLTYEMWKRGERSGEGPEVAVEARCGERDPEAPAFRRIPG
jgi:hypothetical protein